MNKEAIFAYNPLLLHFLIWFIMTVVTYGTAVPAGLFLPGILIGCTLGRMLTLFIGTNVEAAVSPATYSIIGAASVLAGYSRMSFSLAVIMLETTENVNLFLPMLFALFISFAVGRLFNRSIYVAALGAKNVPFLIETVPHFNAHIRAKDLISETLKFLPSKPTLKQIGDLLKETSHNSFPVLSEDSKLKGLITRFNLIRIIQEVQRLEI
jgi:chloride channel 7